MNFPPQGENYLAGDNPEPSPGAADQQTQIVDAGASTPEIAPPSSAEDQQVQSNEPASMEEAILAALAAETGAPAAQPENAAEPGQAPATSDKGSNADGEPQQQSDATAESGSEVSEDDPTEDELRAMRPGVAKRVKTLLHQRNEARREVEGYRADAEEMRTIRNFTQSNQLADAEVADLFKFGALLKSGDPVKLNEALEIVMPRVKLLMEATGRVVPDDLREKVDSGELSEDMARQLGRERFMGRVAQNRAHTAQQQVQVVQQQQQAHQQQSALNDIRSATAQWYSQTSATDPDFGKKAEAMEAAARAIIARNGPARTPDQAVQYANEAYQTATRWLSAGRQQTPTRPTPSNGSNGSRGTLSAEPTTLEEAVLAGLRSATA